MKALANYRKSSSAIQTGKLMQYIPQNGIYVYFRYDAKSTVMVVYNSTDKNATLNTERFAERTASYNSGINIVTGEKIASIKELNIPGKTALVVELKK